jgi:hypothetical protein
VFATMRICTLLLLLFLHGEVIGQVVRSNGQVDRIDVRLFLHHSGTFSAPLDEKAELWNTIIGEGMSREPSSSLLADVIMKGTPGALGTTVQFKATSARSGKLLAQQTKRIGVYNDDGKYHVGFWLLDTGCEPLRLVARARGSKDVVTQVPFECGE